MNVGTEKNEWRYFYVNVNGKNAPIQISEYI